MHPAYDPIAAEYYDGAAHPTCLNFGELSEQFIRGHVAANLSQRGWWIEVGAGRSLLAPIASQSSARLHQVILLDNSAAMLAHSRSWAAAGAKLVVSDAGAMCLRDRSISLIVAALGDPYNRPEFWQEAARVLMRDGICLYTTPSVEWAARFRNKSTADHAEFVVARERVVAVPSYVLPVDAQIRMVAEAGLRVDGIVGYPATALTTRRSPKLDVLERGADVPVVRGFVIRRI